MDINVISLSNNSSSTLEVSDAAFNVPFNEALIHQVVTAYLAAGRAGTHAQKTRSMVRGGGAKPWRQKGTGRARAGTIRSPLWRGGGKTFAATPSDYSQKVNKRMYRGAIQSIISELYRQSRLVVIDDFMVSSPKTKDLISYLKNYALNDLLIVLDGVDKNVYLSARNIRRVEVVDVRDLNPVNLIRFEKVLMSAKAINQLQERLV